ncbi:hypothetical protein WJX84_003901 [Apatococcus fuscideae]|uniref:Exonuclease domain-containing protein n=1 Tax=Apatococcus fuscideae TaxID=2026836 RepID=A0AAW1T638_9CHLO
MFENSNSKATASAGECKPRRLSNPIAWLDLEMTGLDLEKDTILQAAMIITDGQLRKQIKGPDIAVHQPDAVLQSMNDWCTTHHTGSGLVARCRQSSIRMAEAEEQLLAFVQPYTRPGMCPLAGNSVHMDVAFLRKHMPLLLAHFHHRLVDVSSVSELARRWFPQDYNTRPQKSNSHLAMADIQESIDELQHYRSTIFRKK